MPTTRLAKVNALIKTELGQAIGRLFGQPGILATVTEVETTADLREAVAWIGLVPDDDQSWQLVEALLPQLQAHLAERLTLKFTPRLRLRRDQGAAHAAKIDQLLGRDDS